MSFKIATWNVNSLRVRLPHLFEWLAYAQPDVICLQETKILDTDFPLAEITDAGYQVIYSGQKTYNGVAILSRHPMTDIVTDVPDYVDPQRRVLGVTIGNLRIFNLYVPNGSHVGSEKYLYKLQWLEQLTGYLRTELHTHPQMLLLGDFNIAPEDRDVHDPVTWQGHVLMSEPERAKFKEIISLGFADTFRLFDQAEKSYSWWDYRQGAFRRNQGWRIDHILASEALQPACLNCVIDKLPRAWDRPSDHVPVMAEFQLVNI